MLVVNKFLLVFMIIILMEIMFNSSLFDCLDSGVVETSNSFVVYKNNKLNYVSNIYDIDVELTTSNLTIITLEYDGHAVDYMMAEEEVENEVYYLYCGSLYRPIDETLLIYSEDIPEETLPHQIVIVGTECYYIYIGDTTSGDSTSEDTTSGDSTSEDTTSGDSTSEDTTSGDTTSGDTTST